MKLRREPNVSEASDIVEKGERAGVAEERSGEHQACRVGSTGLVEQPN